MIVECYANHKCQEKELNVEVHVAVTRTTWTLGLVC